MTLAEFASLPKGAVVENGLGWRYTVTSHTKDGRVRATRVDGTGRNQHLQQKRRTGFLVTARSWRRVA